MLCTTRLYVIFFFNDTATTEIYTLSLHDALPISAAYDPYLTAFARLIPTLVQAYDGLAADHPSRSQLQEQMALFRRSEEHTSELQSRQYLVCRLLLEKKKIISIYIGIRRLDALPR